MPPVKSWMREPDPGSKRSIHMNAKEPMCGDPSAAR
jgi:hypothetical protein